ncbi:hypothetical protein [Paenibacillus xylaniclasticus]|uniref:hypothetical protein n=1 Tax=Paenibacillus xylaniclasticus TaxID=588083 RepID=UPI000FD88F8C|nr:MULTISPECIES: hypothetical protein [Paenibacillus]GFN32563.1 hypothetical protein PCURB6_28230 [Paenibacillus curdlanolyticus]
MNIHEMYDLVKQIRDKHEDEYRYIGIRFEDKTREIGEECEWSKHNPDREDEREFPVFGSEEYDDLPELNGTSAWGLETLTDHHYPGFGRASSADLDRECSRYFDTYHCYIVAGNQQGRHDEPDEEEILIKDAVVIAKIF